MKENGKRFAGLITLVSLHDSLSLEDVLVQRKADVGSVVKAQPPFRKYGVRAVTTRTKFQVNLLESYKTGEFKLQLRKHF